MPVFYKNKNISPAHINLIYLLLHSYLLSKTLINKGLFGSRKAFLSADFPLLFLLPALKPLISRQLARTTNKKQAATLAQKESQPVFC